MHLIFGVSDDLDMPVLHGTADASSLVLLGERESGVDAGDDPVQLCEDVVRVVELAVAEDVHFAPGQEREVAVHAVVDDAHLLDLFEKEMRVAMTLTGARTIADLNSESLVSEGVSALGHLAK